MEGSITTLDLFIYAVVSFGVSILGGITGGGGGFIMTPLSIFLGLTPAESVATGKVSGLAVTLGSLNGMKGIKRASNRRMLIIIIMALAVGLLAPLAIVRLESELYKKVLGILLLAMIPVLIWKKVGRTEHTPSPLKKAVGYILLLLTLGLQAVFSGGLGMLVIVVLMGFLGMPALEANVTKRTSQIMLNVVILLGVLFTGLIYWPIALIGIFTAGIGGNIGGKMAVKRGNAFVMAILIILMFVSAVELLVG